MNSNEMIVIDLPSLQSITLGWCALAGVMENINNSLAMRSIFEID